MGNCCFFGHKQIRKSIDKILKETIRELISEKDIDTFYVGNNGAFDLHVSAILEELKNEIPNIKYNIVLAYLNTPRASYNDNTIYPEGLESVPKRFAVYKRNLWMLKQCDYVVAYIEHPFGNAEKFVDIALTKGKAVINIADKINE